MVIWRFLIICNRIRSRNVVSFSSNFLLPSMNEHNKKRFKSSNLRWKNTNSILLFWDYRLYVEHVAFFRRDILSYLDELLQENLRVNIRLIILDSNRFLERLTSEVHRDKLWLDDDRDSSMEWSTLIFLKQQMHQKFVDWQRWEGSSHRDNP